MKTTLEMESGLRGNQSPGTGGKGLFLYDRESS